MTDWYIKKVKRADETPVEFVERMQLYASYENIISLDLEIGSEESRDVKTLADFVPSDEPTPEEKFLENERKRNLMEILTKCCSSREIRVLYGYYVEEKTLQALGDEFGFSREYIRQIRNSGIKKVREYLRLNNINKEDL